MTGKSPKKTLKQMPLSFLSAASVRADPLISTTDASGFHSTTLANSITTTTSFSSVSLTNSTMCTSVPDFVSANPTPKPSPTRNDVSSETQWPSVWTEIMWNEKRTLHQWLICCNGKLDCSVCRSVGNTVGYTIQGSTVSMPWIRLEISTNGSDPEQQLKSLRKKISAHALSHAHKSCMKIMDAAEKKKMEKVVDDMNKADVDATIKVFRTAYF